MVFFFRFILRRAAIRSYRKSLYPYLEKQFGWRGNYTPEQVCFGVSDLGLSTSFLAYAYAMLCTQADFENHHAATGEPCDYVTMHTETLSFGTGSHSASNLHGDSDRSWFDHLGHHSDGHHSDGHHSDGHHSDGNDGGSHGFGGGHDGG
jgi:hypothetical protein